jgi:hypothetical protein
MIDFTHLSYDPAGRDAEAARILDAIGRFAEGDVPIPRERRVQFGWFLQEAGYEVRGL